jgi:hypothetical protein
MTEPKKIKKFSTRDTVLDATVAEKSRYSVVVGGSPENLRDLPESLSKNDIPVLRAIKREPKATKKQSITLKDAGLVELIAEKYRWSVNDLVNYALELFLFFLDTDSENPQVLFEARCFQILRDYAARQGISDGEALREAVEIFARFYADLLIERGSKISAVQDGTRSLQGIFSNILSEGLKPYESAP